MKWVLIWVVITGHGVTSGSTNFATEDLCEQAALGTKVELVTDAIVKVRCYPRIQGLTP